MPQIGIDVTPPTEDGLGGLIIDTPPTVEPPPSNGTGGGSGGGAPAPAPPVDTPPPESPTDPGESIPSLDSLSWLIVLLGLVALATVLVEAFNNLVRWIMGPLWRRAGSKQATPLQFTQWLSNALGSQYSSLENELGQSFTKLGDAVTGVGGAILQAERVAYQTAVRVRAIGGAAAGAGAQSSTATRTANKAATDAAAAAAAATAAGASSRAAEARLAAELKVETTYRTTVIEPELEQLRHRIGSLEKGAVVLWNEVAEHSEALGLDGLTAGVASALGRLGGGWIRCETNQLVGRELCQSDSDLIRQLLNGLLDAMVIADLCAIVSVVGDGAQLAGDFLDFAAGSAAGLIACQSSDRAADLPVAWYAPPTSEQLVAL